MSEKNDTMHMLEMSRICVFFLHCYHPCLGSGLCSCNSLLINLAFNFFHFAISTNFPKHKSDKSKQRKSSNQKTQNKMVLYIPSEGVKWYGHYGKILWFLRKLLYDPQFHFWVCMQKKWKQGLDQILATALG